MSQLVTGNRVNVADLAGSCARVTAGSDNQTTTGQYGVCVNAALQVNDGTSSYWVFVRTPKFWKAASATNINTTALWTPTGGKKFRLMGFSWAIPSNSTSVAGSVVSLLDSAATICYVSAIGATTGAQSGCVNFAVNGYLSAAVDQVLYMQLSAAFTAGAIYMTAWGTEE